MLSTNLRRRYPARVCEYELLGPGHVKAEGIRVDHGPARVIIVRGVAPAPPVGLGAAGAVGERAVRVRAQVARAVAGAVRVAVAAARALVVARGAPGRAPCLCGHRRVSFGRASPAWKGLEDTDDMRGP